MKESEKNLMGCVVARNQWGGNNEKKRFPGKMTHFKHKGAFPNQVTCFSREILWKEQCNKTPHLH